MNYSRLNIFLIAFLAIILFESAEAKRKMSTIVEAKTRTYKYKTKTRTATLQVPVPTGGYKKKGNCFCPY